MLTKADYLKTEDGFYKLLESSIGSEIYLYCVTGSLGRDEIIVGWSDIDVLLVIKNYTLSTFEKINAALSESSKKIKIGITIFSFEEFNAKYFKDSKTYISIKLIRTGLYQPRIMVPEVKLVGDDQILKKFMDVSAVSGLSHDIKRELLKLDGYDEKKVYKQIITILKIALYQIDLVPLGYKDVLKNAFDNLPKFNIKIVTPEEIMTNSNKKAERYHGYMDFISWLKQNVDSFFK